MWKRFILPLLPLLILLALPLWLQPDPPLRNADETVEKLVVITPHTEPVKQEFADAFVRHYHNKYGRNIEIEYRSVGGTSDIVRYLADRYEAEFRRHHENTRPDNPWNAKKAAAYANPWIDPRRHQDSEERDVRKMFLDSDVSVGIDIFWGGGTFDHSRQAMRGFGVDAGVAKRHPEYLAPDIIPKSFGGDNMYDPAGRYYGVCLASFGICYNPDRVNELPERRVPATWRDLGEIRFFNQTVLADPTKSGSANKCYEAILQQEMALAPTPAEGWANGFNLIKRIGANARAITDSASKVPREISSGNAAAGMAIDTYGLAEQEFSSMLFAGKPRIFYVPPKGGTSVSADPVQLLRGAPNRKAACEFIDFLLSPAGQKLWNYRPGTPGGPKKYALRRPPIRRDLYTGKHTQFFSDPDYNPYEAGADFTYKAAWTSPYFSLIRILIKCIVLDVQPELNAAWAAIIKAGGPEKVPQAFAAFNRLPFTYAEAREATRLLRPGASRTVLDVNNTCRSWSLHAIASYREAAKLAAEGK